MLLIRDEVANMVWASSVACRLPSGETKRDSEAGYETRHFFERPAEPAAAPVPGAGGAKVRYRVMEGVAENLIPFVPVHVPRLLT
ncbi:MAG TPA: hypothetical protein VF940_20925 [Streptosporangiaceae bacterium]